MNIELNRLLDSYIDDENFDYSCYISIEKKLKALEIIKHCFKDFIEFNEIELPHINKIHYEIKIFNETIYVSKEKYDLLKEVLL